MIDSGVVYNVGILAAEMMFDTCVPNETLLRQALSFDADSIDGVEDVTLSKYILVLTQYLVTLKYRENEAAVRKIEYSRTIEVMSAKSIKTTSWKTNTPLKQKLLEVASDNPDILEAMHHRDLAEGELTILNGMVSVFTEYANAYKREQSRRSLFSSTQNG